MTTLEWLLIAWAVVLVINIIPAFMPSTWMVIAFFLIAYNLPLWPLCFGGAVTATAGRCILALLSERWGTKLLSEKQRQNVAVLGEWLNSKSGWSKVLAVFLYSLGPIPSNQIFIAAGLSRLRLAPIAAGFFAGRLISYPLLAGSVKKISDNVGDIFLQEWKSPRFIILELLSLAMIVLFAHIDWPRVLHIKMPSATSADAGKQADSSTGDSSIDTRQSSA